MFDGLLQMPICLQALGKVAVIGMVSAHSFSVGARILTKT